MGKYIDWYLVELERMLKGSVRPEELASTLTEVETHLKDLTAGLTHQCQHGENPEKIAIDRFGLPEKIAMSLIITKGQVAYWRFGYIVAISVAIAFFLNIIAIHSSLAAVITGFLISLAAVVFFVVIGTVKTRKVLVGAIVLGVASMYLVFTAGNTLSYGSSPSAQKAAQLSNSIKQHPILEAKLNDDLAWVEKGIKDHKSVLSDKSLNQQVGKLPIGKYPRIASFYDPETSRLVVNTENSQIPFQRLNHVYVDSSVAKKWWLTEAPQIRMGILQAIDNLNIDYKRTMIEYQRPFGLALLFHLSDFILEFLSYTLGLITLSAISLKLYTSDRRMKLIRKSIA